jgi:hypothetical protein
MNCKLTVYRVEECGYYARGADTHTCCDLRKCLTDICRWISAEKPTIEKTCAYPGDDNGTSMPVYCFDAAAHGKNDFLITTWNETPSEDGVVGAVVRNQIAGSAGVATANLPTNSIPGYGTHFWFLADRQRLVTVRFDSQPLNGHAGLNYYMRGYLERFSPHVRFADPTDQGDIFIRNVIGYATDDDDEECDPHLRPRFKSFLLRKNSEIGYIKKHRAAINRVIRKARPTTGGNATRTLLDRMLEFVGASPANRALPDQNFHFEVPYTPTETELNNIITAYQEDDHETWDDIGFDFKGDPVRRWLSSSTLKAEIELPDGLRDGAASLAAAQALLRELQPFRNQVSA